MSASDLLCCSATRVSNDNIRSINTAAHDDVSVSARLVLCDGRLKECINGGLAPADCKVVLGKSLLITSASTGPAGKPVSLLSLASEYCKLEFTPAEPKVVLGGSSLINNISSARGSGKLVSLLLVTSEDSAKPVLIALVDSKVVLSSSELRAKPVLMVLTMLCCCSCSFSSCRI